MSWHREKERHKLARQHIKTTQSQQLYPFEVFCPKCGEFLLTDEIFDESHICKS
jgi:hypothetical protein